MDYLLQGLQFSLGCIFRKVSVYFTITGTELAKLVLLVVL